MDSSAPGFSSSDLAQFDQQFGLPNPPSLTKYNEQGQTTDLPGTDPAGAGNPDGTWEIEESLDVEWVHAIAPGPSIDLVEANSPSFSDLWTAVSTAASLPGVSVVSMSWGSYEFEGEQSYDSTFTTPTGHQGVTFVASSGDDGGIIPCYPAFSPNVVAAGGTSLPLDSQGDYPGTGPFGETGWSGSGGGTSQYETEPAYQQGVQNTGDRTTPDVAWDADPNTGVAVYDSFDDTDGSGPWVQIGGTSVAAPSWSGLFAIVSQSRAAEGLSSLDGPSNSRPYLSAPAGDFNDITSGNNGFYNAGPGYDEVTGLGTPSANLLISDLAFYGTAVTKTSKLVVSVEPSTGVIGGDPFGLVVSAENSLGDVNPNFNGTVAIALDSNPSGATISGPLTATASDGQAIFDGLTINDLGTGYTLAVSGSDLTPAVTEPFDIIANPTPGSGTYYPVPTDSSLPHGDRCGRQQRRREQHHHLVGSDLPTH